MEVLQKPVVSSRSRVAPEADSRQRYAAAPLYGTAASPRPDQPLSSDHHDSETSDTATRVNRVFVSWTLSFMEPPVRWMGLGVATGKAQARGARRGRERVWCCMNLYTSVPQNAPRC